MSWRGLDSKDEKLTGLGQLTVAQLVDEIYKLKFNVIRIPFSLQFALNEVATDGYTQLEALFDRAEELGIFVMLSLHSFDSGGDVANSLWYTTKYSEEDTFKGLANMLKKYSNRSVELYCNTHRSVGVARS